MKGRSRDPTILRVGGREIPLVVSRHPRARRITLRLDGASGDVRLVLPGRTALREGLDFAETKAAWLVDQIEALPVRVPFIPGAVVPLRDRAHVIRHRPEARRGVWPAQGEILVSGCAEHVPRRVADFLRETARRELSTCALVKAARVGRDVRRVNVRDMKSRWGSCSTDGRLCFSWRLILAPGHVLDYVVAHEVAHLEVMNHGRRFWALVARLTNDLEGARTWLRDHGDELMRYG